MTLEEFYTRVGGDHEEVVRRLGGEPRIKRVLGMLERDKSMDSLRAALEQRDYEAAFRAAHTLKGIAVNLGLTRLAQADTELTETLRPGRECEGVRPQFDRVQRYYTEAMEAVAGLLEGSEAGKAGEHGAAAE